ncbi:MAG: hypothetical protein WCI95_02315 [bacterium]
MTEPNNLMEQKLRCVSLLLDCPLNRNALGCPFSKLRQEDVVNRVNWVIGMDTASLTEMLARHETCMAQPSERVPR